jgi:uncharacterized protein (UPF0332 family)
MVLRLFSRRTGCAVRPRSRTGVHGGVLSLFGSEVVVEGDASREQGRFLNDLSALRKQADYGYESVDEDIEELLERTAAFVGTMEAVAEEG